MFRRATMTTAAVEPAGILRDCGDTPKDAITGGPLPCLLVILLPPPDYHRPRHRQVSPAISDCRTCQPEPHAPPTAAFLCVLDGLCDRAVTNMTTPHCDVR